MGGGVKKAHKQVREYMNTAIELSVPEPGEELFAFLGQSETAIRGVLFRKENRNWKLVFYISTILKYVE